MDAHTGNNCGPVLQAEGGEVQTAEDNKKEKNRKIDVKFVIKETHSNPFATTILHSATV